MKDIKEFLVKESKLNNIKLNDIIICNGFLL